MTLREYAKQKGACAEGLKWLGDRNLQQMWNECQRSDWMAWLLEQLGYNDERVLRLYACWCVRQVWHLLTDECSRTAVEVAERFAVGEATRDELGAAADAAWGAARAAADAARAAAARAAAAWDAAADAARAAAARAAAARDAAADAVRAAAWARQAGHLREVIPYEVVAQLFVAAGGDLRA